MNEKATFIQDLAAPGPSTEIIAWVDGSQVRFVFRADGVHAKRERHAELFLSYHDLLAQVEKQLTFNL